MSVFLWCAAFVSGCGADVFGNASVRFAYVLAPHVLTPSRSRASGFAAGTAVGRGTAVMMRFSVCFRTLPKLLYFLYRTLRKLLRSALTLCPPVFSCAFYTLSASRRRDSRASKFGGSGQVKCMASPVRGWVKDNSPACRHWPSSRAACFFSKGVGAPP